MWIFPVGNLDFHASLKNTHANVSMNNSLYIKVSLNWRKNNIHFFNYVYWQTHQFSRSVFIIKPFPHTAILQQTLNVFCQKIENLHTWMDNLCQKVGNIVAKGELARFVQFLLLSLCFQKDICCRGVRKRLYEGKG